MPHKLYRIRTGEYVQQAARHLRRRATPTEALLWDHLRHRRLHGLKFRRQHPIGPFVADLYCPAARLVIEIDGSSHHTRAEADAARTEWLHHHGYRVIRFTVEQVVQHIDDVLAAIAQACGIPPSPP
jgi:very-short-patch-repair endonuclease